MRRAYWLAIFSTGASASTDAACVAARCDANASANSAACAPTVSSWAATFASEQLSALSKRVSSVLTAAPKGVGQPRSAWTIYRSDVSTVPAACQPYAVTMQPTARPSRYGRSSARNSSSVSSAFLTRPETPP